MDGDPIGRIKCKIANWTGIVYKIPRISIDNCDDIQELTQSGVYLLFGTDKDENTVVYIGQAGNRKNGRGLLQRICEPHNSIDYWSEVIILTTGDGSFGPTEISYLENRLFNMARKAGRYDVKIVTTRIRETLPKRKNVSLKNSSIMQGSLSAQ